MLKSSIRSVVTAPPIMGSSPSTVPNASSLTSEALAASLYQTIPSSAAAPSSTSSSFTSSSSSSASSPPLTRMKHAVCHPSRPWMASVLELPEVKLSAHRQLVVQDIRSNSSAVKVLWKMTIGDVCAVMFDLDRTSPNFPTKQAAALRTLGTVQKIQFFDAATLHASGMVVEGSSHFHYSTSITQQQQAAQAQAQAAQQQQAGAQKQQQQQQPLPPPPSFTTEERFEHLIVQFTARIVILNLRQGPHSHSVEPSLRWIHPSPNVLKRPYLPVVSQITESLLKALPTSIALPLTPHLVVVGCSDGTLRVFDIQAEKVLKSNRGPSGKNDAVWHLMAANPYNQFDGDDDDLYHHHHQPKTKNYFDAEKVIKRVISISKKGTAYLWEIVLQRGTLIDIRLPLAKMEGLVVLNNPTTPHERRFGTSSGAEGNSTTPHHLHHGHHGHHGHHHHHNSHHHHLHHTGSSSTLSNSTGGGVSSNNPLSSNSSASTPSASHESAFWEHSLVEFDAHRQLFYWFIPTGYKNNSKPHLLVYDMTESSSLKRKKTTVVPKQEPYVISFPTVDVPFTLVPGWLHPAFPSQAITCALITNVGDLLLQVVAFRECKYSKETKATPWFGASVPALVQKDTGAAGLPVVRATSLQSLRRLDPTILIVGTSNMGYLQVELELLEGDAGARHAHLGAGLGSEFGESVLSVNHSDVVWAPLDIQDFRRNKPPPPPQQQQQQQQHAHPLLLGRVNVVRSKQAVVYKSPPSLELTPEMQKRSVRLPPRFLPSPSGNFLCLYWPDERRYEILHLATLLRRATTNSSNSTSDTTVQTSPAVASGHQVLSFAWVGDDDAFCLLHPPLESRGGDDGAASSTSSSHMLSSDSASQGGNNLLSSASSVGGSVKGALRNPFQIGRNRLSSGHSVGGGAAGSTMSSTPTPHKDDSYNASRFFPRVELKILVGVTANAAEMGSVAAATARGLGDITLRGGNRNPPTALFGGPVLCVASKGAKGDGGTAYFYTKKAGTADTEYVSSGPTLPYPSFVEWDDDGKLCAVVVQGLVAVYLSQEPNFVLLGNVQLGAPTERHVRVTGLAFVHGALYCSTKTAVQCIFLGDAVEDGVCHLDSFVLASADGPTLPHRSFSLTPPTVPMTLNHPVVLGYQSGSLLVSTVTGICAIPLHHPLLRIGALIAAGQHNKAQRWFEAIPPSEHEALAFFLDRRGAADLAVGLPGLSLETQVDLSLRYGLTDTLVELVEVYGLDGLRKIDMGRGVTVGIVGSEEHDHSIVVCVGAYLLSEGRVQLVKELAEECLEEGCRNEAFVLGSLLMSVEAAEAKKLVQTAVGPKLEKDENSIVIPIFEASNDYPVTSLVRENIL